ncbi:UNVERIFIED_CONTAM: hypothetical protein GTU68_049309 [Idotea baltica]|nr:hypothetical protein [Idotea baltica]
MNIDIISGTRPNLVKISPIIKAIRKSNRRRDLNYRLVHTGQHYDDALSQCFFRDLDIPEPDINLHVGSGSQATQTARIMVRYEEVLLKNKPDICLVVGDVNSTMACALTAKKCNVPVAHVEAGIRSGDWKMPEETNRVVTDAISDWFYTTGETADKNLLNSGVSKDRIVTVGNTMIDSLKNYYDFFKQPPFWNTFSLEKLGYIVLTLHRPDNVDNADQLRSLLTTIDEAAGAMKIVFPVHPRTRKILDGLELKMDKILPVDPMSYLEFMYLVKHSTGVITDSGGLSEETTYLKVPCITIRTSTERPETVSIGTNVLVGKNIKALSAFQDKMINSKWKQSGLPDLWDGLAAQRIVSHLANQTVLHAKSTQPKAF